jgi:polyisoprenoid-binding protein YceI
MTTATTGLRSQSLDTLPTPVGEWRVDPLRSSAAFSGRFAGRHVRGRLPLAGEAVVTDPVEDSTAQFVARTDAVRTGHDLLDRLLAGPGFLDADAFPEIRFRSEMLVCVPTGWRAVGDLLVEGTEHPLVCELEADLRHSQPGAAAMTLTSGWVIDSTWITSQRWPGLSRRIVMTCSVALVRHG